MDAVDHRRRTSVINASLIHIILRQQVLRSLACRLIADFAEWSVIYAHHISVLNTDVHRPGSPSKNVSRVFQQQPSGGSADFEKSDGFAVFVAVAGPSDNW